MTHQRTRDDHIQAAEHLLGRVPGCACARCLTAPAAPSPENVARAQVHALLAVAMSQPEVPR